MKIIILHDPSGFEIYLNTQYIAGFWTNDDGENVVLMNTGNSYGVNEVPEYILQVLTVLNGE